MNKITCERCGVGPKGTCEHCGAPLPEGEEHEHHRGGEYHVDGGVSFKMTRDGHGRITRIDEITEPVKIVINSKLPDMATFDKAMRQWLSD